MVARTVSAASAMKAVPHPRIFAGVVGVVAHDSGVVCDDHDDDDKWCGSDAVEHRVTRDCRMTTLHVLVHADIEAGG